LEKLQLLEQEKAKIRKEYERREGQVEVKKKMCAFHHVGLPGCSCKSLLRAGLSPLTRVVGKV
jgi:hypothetical protein